MLINTISNKTQTTLMQYIGKVITDFTTNCIVTAYGE